VILTVAGKLIKFKKKVVSKSYKEPMTAKAITNASRLQCFVSASNERRASGT